MDRDLLCGGIDTFLDRFQAVLDRAKQGTINAGSLFELEHEAHQFLKKKFPEYKDFAFDRPLTSHWAYGTRLGSWEAQVRIGQRMSRLREARALVTGHADDKPSSGQPLLIDPTEL